MTKYDWSIKNEHVSSLPGISSLWEVSLEVDVHEFLSILKLLFALSNSLKLSVSSQVPHVQAAAISPA